MSTDHLEIDKKASEETMIAVLPYLGLSLMLVNGVNMQQSELFNSEITPATRSSW